MPRELAQGIGARLAPVMPSIRETANGIMQDIRPMLSFKQQLKLTGEVAVMNVALDALEKNMNKWAKGDADPFGNPFQTEETELQKDAEGETQALKNARRMAEAQSKQQPGAAWDRYVEEAKKYYELDPSQAAAADSLLRDYKERAQVSVGGHTEWQAKLYRNRLLWGLSMSLSGRWSNPLYILLERDYMKMREPVDSLGDELKRRIDEIPTQAQRDAADRRIQALLKEKGLDLDEPAAVTTPAPAGEVSN